MGFFFFIKITQLDVRTEFSQSGTDGLTRDRILTNQSVSVIYIRSFELIRFFYPCMEGCVKGLDHFSPIGFPIGDVIKFLFDFGCKLNINNRWEMLYQKIIYNQCGIGREQLVFFGASDLNFGFTLNFLVG